MNTSAICFCPASEEVETLKDFSLDIFETIENVSEAQWNKQIPEANFLMQYDELKLIESIRIAKFFKFFASCVPEFGGSVAVECETWNTAVPIQMDDAGDDQGRNAEEQQFRTDSSFGNASNGGWQS